MRDVGINPPPQYNGGANGENGTVRGCTTVVYISTDNGRVIRGISVVVPTGIYAPDAPKGEDSHEAGSFSPLCGR